MESISKSKFTFSPKKIFLKNLQKLFSPSSLHLCFSLTTTKIPQILNFHVLFVEASILCETW